MPIYTLFDNRCKDKLAICKDVLQHTQLTEFLTFIEK